MPQHNRHSDAQLADFLTKDADKARASYELLEKRGFTWRLVYDPRFSASRRRTQKGIDVLDEMPAETDTEQHNANDDVGTPLCVLDPEQATMNPELVKAIRSLYLGVEKYPSSQF